jgi:hypothetical protein
MGKWLAAGGIAIFVIVLLLWLQLRPSEPERVTRKATAVQAPTTEAKAEAKPATETPPTTAAQTAAVADTAPPQVPPGKLDPRSDEFFYKFDEAMPKRLTQNAAKCYEGRHGQLHRNQKLSLRFKTKVVNGEVSVHDVTIKASTLNDPALETCFIQEVMRSSWKDDELPDWEQDDELVLRPERGMKKFWRDNVDYVGEVAPRL